MFDFSDFFEVGLLLSQVDDDAYIRSAIGRYYYAVFGCVRRYLVEIMHEFEFKEEHDIHSRIRKRLLNSSDNTEHYIGELLDDLRKLRNDADYEWQLEDERYFIKNHLKAADNSKIALEQVVLLRNSPPFEL